MASMIERVARAICESQYSPDPVPADVRWEDWEVEATVAIAAMREPTEAMVSAGAETIDFDERVEPSHEMSEIVRCWQVMHDVALGKETA
jgi:hypothetical protein